MTDEQAEALKVSQTMFRLAGERLEQITAARQALAAVYRAVDLKHAQDLASNCLQALNAMDNKKG